MIIGFEPGAGVLHRAHPFTTLTLAAVTAVGAFALPAPVGPGALVGALVVLALVARLPRTLVTAGAVAAPFWLFLGLIHGVLGGDPGRAVVLGVRITALLLAFVVVLASVHPIRLVDALVARGWPFAAAYLVAATLQAVPRLRARARAILEAQRCRGLRVRGAPWRRVAVLIPLAVPLVLGALAEVEERALALEARAAHAAARRTPLDPPPDTARQRLLRWLLLVAAVGVVILRVMP